MKILFVCPRDHVSRLACLSAWSEEHATEWVVGPRRSAFAAWRILSRFRPDVLVCTDAATAAPFARLAGALGTEIVRLEVPAQTQARPSVLVSLR